MVFHLPLGSLAPAAPSELNLFGHDPLGNTLGVNTSFFTRNGSPLFLISGEFHYARFPHTEWEHELLKMQAGGINTVASYTFWMSHEETRGRFDWRGNKDLRHFIELCARHDLYYVLRIGPFSHGEWRNGGLPDWLYGQPFEVRSNDPRYLAYVERFYAEIAAQVRGLFYADGGPIIAIQIENEYMHAGAPWEIDPLGETDWITGGTEGVEHLKQLKHIAGRVGLLAPYYFVTAWGGAPIIEEETLPVYSEYAYPTWIDDPAPSTFYLFRDKHASPVDNPTHRTPRAYPVIMAEQQGGIQVRYNNRPIVPPRSTEAMSLVNIGAGCNALGYYMYHGGTTPHGCAERLHPQLSYDFQAPLGEYGQVRASYRYLKLLHLFLDAYGELLAPMQTNLPDRGGGLTPTDLTSPRYCARRSGDSGFLFVNNFQDHAETNDIENVKFVLETSDGALSIPDSTGLTVRRDTCFILPFHQSLEGARLLYATAQPLTRVRAAGYTHYFYFAPEGITPEFCFDADTCANLTGDFSGCETRENRYYIQPQTGPDKSFALRTPDGACVRVTTLTRAQAEQTWRGEAWSGERVIVCDAPLTFERGGVQVNPLAVSEIALDVFPPVSTPVRAQGAHVGTEPFPFYTRFRLTIPPHTVEPEIRACDNGKYTLEFSSEAWRGVNDIFLRVDYEGDTAMAFLDGELMADNFWNGLPWEIGLKRSAPAIMEKGLVLVFRPFRPGRVKNVSSGMAARLEYEGEEKLVVHSIVALPEYAVWLL